MISVGHVFKFVFTNKTLELKTELLKTLKDSEHTITIEFEDGKVEGVFTTRTVDTT